MVKKNSEEKPSPERMGEKTGNTEPKQQQRSGKGFTIDVVLLDGQHKDFHLDKNADGRELFDKVCQDLDLQEKEYFGLQYVDERLPHHLKCWLSPDKKISKQKKRGPWLFEFALKFYPPDPTALRESLTKWLVVLQVRRDILSGKLPATFLTQAMLGAYCVQADIGDFDPAEHKGTDYIKDIPFSSNQNPELLEKIVELHKHHKGQTPDEAEGHFLENAKKLAMYGVDLHTAQDAEHVDIMLGVCASGLQVYRDKLRINRFVWPKILKISYKRNHFYIKTRPTDNNQAENNICFKLQSHRLAKRLWKICVEHHAFFRLREADQPQNNAIFPKLGSKFRYSGRTLYQARQKSSDLDRGDPYFERSQPVRSSFAPAKSQSAENMNRPSFYDDTNVDKKRRSSEKTGEDRRDHKYGDDPTLGGKGKDGAMYDEHGNLIRGPGGKEGEDRRDRLSSNDPTLEKEGYGGTANLTPAQLKQKQKEEEKERKRKEEEEKKRKKEEERKRKEDEKKNKGGKGEDRRDQKEGDDPTARKPGYGAGGYGDEHGDDKTGAGTQGYPDGADARRNTKGGLGFGAGFVPGLGVGAGDMTGVGGEEKWIDNKNRFLPIEPTVKETKGSLKGMDGIDHTMPFFSPAATSTVNRHGKVPPPVPRKMVNSFGDDSFSRTDVYKTEKDGIQETRVEHKVVLSSTDDDFDYDAALAEAIRSVTEFNPDMSVERIECVQQIEDVKGK